ncbi:unnamed protein product [Merluccius merluccius]
MAGGSPCYVPALAHGGAVTVTDFADVETERKNRKEDGGRQGHTSIAWVDYVHTAPTTATSHHSIPSVNSQMCHSDWGGKVKKGEAVD